MFYSNKFQSYISSKWSENKTIEKIKEWLLKIQKSDHDFDLILWNDLKPNFEYFSPQNSFKFLKYSTIDYIHIHHILSSVSFYKIYFFKNYSLIFLHL